MRESTERALRWFLRKKLEEERMAIEFRHMDSKTIPEPDSSRRVEIMDLLHAMAADEESS